MTRVVQVNCVDTIIYLLRTAVLYYIHVSNITGVFYFSIQYEELNILYKITLLAVYITYTIIEVVRLYVGYIGNLMERVGSFISPFNVIKKDILFDISFVHKQEFKDISQRNFYGKVNFNMSLTKVILYSYLILKKMNECITDS